MISQFKAQTLSEWVGSPGQNSDWVGSDHESKVQTWFHLWFKTVRKRKTIGYLADSASRWQTQQPLIKAHMSQRC